MCEHLMKSMHLQLMKLKMFEIHVLFNLDSNSCNYPNTSTYKSVIYLGKNKLKRDLKRHYILFCAIFIK